MVFLLPALALSIRPGVGIIEAVILLAAIYFAVPLWKQCAMLFGDARWIVFAFALNLVAAVVSLLRHQFIWSWIDNLVRQLLATLLIGLIILCKPKAHWFWPRLIAGTVIAACVALYQRFGLNWECAQGFHMPILFGDIAMLMALAALPYFAGKRWSFLPWVGFMAGVLSSLLSGTRGGWGAVLLCLAPLYIYRRVALNRTNLVIFGFGLVLLVAAVMTPRLGVSDRIEEITADIEQYEQGNSNSPSGARLEMWRGAWKLFMAHPLKGVGR